MKQKKILAVASGGGHWSQMLMISQAFKKHKVFYLTTELNRAATANPELIVYRVKDADFSQKFGLIRLALGVLWRMLLIRPDIIISTGAAPGFFSIILGRCVGAKTIWVDSIANHDRPSLSGKKIQKFCHLYLTQWPNQQNSHCQYWGHLI